MKHFLKKFCRHLIKNITINSVKKGISELNFEHKSLVCNKILDYLIFYSCNVHLFISVYLFVVCLPIDLQLRPFVCLSGSLVLQGAIRSPPWLSKGATLPAVVYDADLTSCCFAIGVWFID